MSKAARVLWTLSLSVPSLCAAEGGQAVVPVDLGIDLEETAKVLAEFVWSLLGSVWGFSFAVVILVGGVVFLQETINGPASKGKRGTFNRGKKDWAAVKAERERARKGEFLSAMRGAGEGDYDRYKGRRYRYGLSVSDRESYFKSKNKGYGRSRDGGGHTPVVRRRGRGLRGPGMY